ncbi:MAG: class II aldolase/adducin family protein [Spirochaetota bacterium]
MPHGSENDRNALITLSHAYGTDPRWVIAGGGNTSVKTDSTLTIKASGASLGSLDETGLVDLQREKLQALFHKTYADDEAEREREALQDLMNARVPGQGERRPSVETLMHEVLPQKYVMHTHPTLVNGLTCAVKGQEVSHELFGDDLVWIPVVKPGYILGIEVFERVKAYTEDHGTPPWLILLANHGLVVAGDSPEDIHTRQRAVIETISRRIPVQSGSSPIRDTNPESLVKNSSQARRVSDWTTMVRRAVEGSDLRNPVVAFNTDANFLRYGDTSDRFESALRRPFTPDHLVYALRRSIIARQTASDHLPSLVAHFRREFSAPPRVVIVPGLGAFGVSSSETVSRAAAALALDALLINTYAEQIGGASHLPEEQIRFIEGWEVERFRLKASEGGSR